MTTITIEHINRARAELRAAGVTRPTSARVHARAHGIAAAAAPAAPPNRKPISSHVAPSPRKDPAAMPTKRPTVADHHAALADAESKLGLASGAHLDLGARAERVQLAAERVLDPAKAQRAEQKAAIDRFMGLGPKSGGVRDEGVGGRRQVFEPSGRR